MLRLFLISSIILLISGCAPCEPQIIKVPVKCTVSMPEEPNIDNKHYDDNASIVRKVLNNYTAMKEYSEKLKASLDTCR